MSAGLTLVEVLVVVLVIGLGAMIAAPAVRRAAIQDDVGRAANGFARVLGDARRSAVERGIAVSVTVAPQPGRYWVVTESDATTLVLAQDTLPDATGLALVPGGGRPRFTFQPSGAAAGDSLVFVGAGAAAVVLVEPLTGDVRVERR